MSGFLYVFFYVFVSDFVTLSIFFLKVSGFSGFRQFTQYVENLLRLLGSPITRRVEKSSETQSLDMAILNSKFQKDLFSKKASLTLF